MTLAISRRLYWIPLGLAGVATAAFSFIGGVVAWVGTGFSGLTGWRLLLSFYPVLAFPLFLLVFFSLRLAANLLMLYVLFLLTGLVAYDWPKVDLGSLRQLGWLPILAAFLVMLAYCMKAKADPSPPRGS